MASISTTAETSNTNTENDDVIDYTEGVTPLQYYLLGTTLLSVTIAGIFFNAVAIAVFVRYRELRSPTNSFIISLCVCDFFMSLVGCPIPAVYAFKRTIITSQALCSADAFIVYFLACTSIYLLAAISIDRYVIMVKPRASVIMTQRAANVSIAVCFILGFIWATLPLAGWNAYSLEGIGIACSITWNNKDIIYTSFIVALFIGCFIAPLLVMGVCYIHIFIKVRNIFRRTFVNTQRRNFHIESRMIKIIIVMIVLFLISWTPYAVVSFSMAFDVRPSMSRLMETLPALLAKSSCVWNPVVYVCMNTQFRAAFVSILPFGRPFVAQGHGMENDEDCTDINSRRKISSKDGKSTYASSAKNGSGGRPNPCNVITSTLMPADLLSNTGAEGNTLSFVSDRSKAFEVVDSFEHKEANIEYNGDGTGKLILNSDYLGESSFVDDDSDTKRILSKSDENQNPTTGILNIPADRLPLAWTDTETNDVDKTANDQSVSSSLQDMNTVDVDNGMTPATGEKSKGSSAETSRGKKCEKSYPKVTSHNRTTELLLDNIKSGVVDATSARFGHTSLQYNDTHEEHNIIRSKSHSEIVKNGFKRFRCRSVPDTRELF